MIVQLLLNKKVIYGMLRMHMAELVPPNSSPLSFMVTLVMSIRDPSKISATVTY